MKEINYKPTGTHGILLLCVMIIGELAHGQAGKEALLEKEFRNYLRPAVFSLTMVMVHDVVNPPAAARYYAYALLGAYDLVARQGSSTSLTSAERSPGTAAAAMPGPAAFIASYPKREPWLDEKNYDARIAALYCILESGKLLLPSGYLLKDEEDKFILFLKKKRLPADLISRSLSAATAMAARIVEWSKTDHYNQLSALRRYTPLKEEGHWYPTPPAYMEAVEPHWNTIRPMMIDSANQFTPPALTPFSKDNSSAMFYLAKEVYDSSFLFSEEQLTAADFWDCNPFNVSTSGHMAIGLKKISPGGHWMDITGIVCRKDNLDFGHAVQAHALVAVTLMDAFISCWDEKYRSNRIRPETYINKYIDIKWHPRLQTPPFPEYTSGHSVISAAAAEILTYLFGDDFSYMDNSEELFDIRPRSFHSFREAADEAAISRFYGGIHYRDAVVAGQVEGKSVGRTIRDRVRMAGIGPYRKPKLILIPKDRVEGKLVPSIPAY